MILGPLCEKVTYRSFRGAYHFALSINRHTAKPTGDRRRSGHGKVLHEIRVDQRIEHPLWQRGQLVKTQVTVNLSGGRSGPRRGKRSAGVSDRKFCVLGARDRKSVV